MGTLAYIPIYSKRLAGYLLLKGFLLEDYQKSHKDSERTIPKSC